MAPVEAARRLIRALSAPRPGTNSDFDDFWRFSFPKTEPAAVELQPWPAKSTTTETTTRTATASGVDSADLATPYPPNSPLAVLEDYYGTCDTEDGHQQHSPRLHDLHLPGPIEHRASSFPFNGAFRRGHSRSNSGSTLNTLLSSSSGSSSCSESEASAPASSQRRQPKPKKKKSESETCWRTYWD